MQKKFKQISNLIVGKTEYSSEELATYKANIVELPRKNYHLLLDNMSICAELVSIDIDKKFVILKIDFFDFDQEFRPFKAGARCSRSIARCAIIIRILIR